MSDTSGQKWIVKLEDGRIGGPYTTQRVLEKIARGAFTGDEQISIYPGGEWISISAQPKFYDQLLGVLSGAIDDFGEDDKSERITNKSRPETKSSKAASAEMTDQTFSEPSQQTADAEASQIELERTRVAEGEEYVSQADDDFDLLSDNEVDEDETYQYDNPRRRTKTQSQNNSEQASKKSRSGLKAKSKSKKSKPEDIELVDFKKSLKKKIQAKQKWPFLVVSIALIFGVIVLSLPGQPKRGQLTLKMINSKTAKALSAEQIKSKTALAVSSYLRDTLRDYRAAEGQLVSLLGADTRNLNLYGILCLTQFEIWPFAKQSSADIAAIDQAIQKSSAVDPTHLYAHTCRASGLILKGKMEEASSFVEQILSTYRGGKVPPIPFYYFKAVLLANAKDYQTAIGYANSAHQLWPQWLRAYILEAQLHMKLGDDSSAYQILSRIYESNKEHAATKTLLGIIEHQQFGKPERALAFLKSGLKNADQMPRDIAAEGSLVLSKIYLSQNNQDAALKAAETSYKYNPSNETVKNLVLRLGGKSTLAQENLKAHELMLEGDQFIRQGDCQSAQAHYKSAYEIDNKLGMAAYKAAKCLWEVSFSTEAIQWMKKAIQADPKLIDAYVELADYYSQRFDFIAAAQVLNAAQRVDSKSHKIMRGYAMVELRRQNPKAAISFAKQALLIYSNDVDSMVVLSQAYLLGRTQIQEAFANAAKAVEIDSSHRMAQVTYARALARLQGADFGAQHLEDLINRNPVVEEYRMALGQIYFEDERYSQAESVFRQLVEIQDKPKSPLMELGKVLKVQGQYQQALDAFFKAAVFDPSDAQPFYEAGVLLLEFKKPKDAKKQFGRVLLTNEKFPLIHYQLGQAELQLNSPKNALREAEKEKRANPNLAAAYQLSAEAHSKMKQYSLCAQDYQRAIKLRPQGAPTYVKAAACYRLGGNFDSAESMLKIASRQESGHPQIYREQGALYEARGDFEKAVAAYQEYFILDPNAPDRALIEKRIQRFNR